LSPRHSSATQHELARIGLFAELPGEVLARLAALMEREALGPGESPEPGEDRIYAVLSGMLTTPERRVLRPGDHFEGTARALTPAAVASCDRAAFEELVRR
jgi:hypothetical protein